jgi:MFS family permease
VLGESATSSGAILTPLMLALIAASVTAGQVVARTGRYRAILLAGPVVMAAGFYLLTELGVGSSTAETTRALIVIGLGVGLGMQTYVLVVQNAVPQRLMGVATSTTQFSRTVGATIGVSVMGAILASRLHDELAERVPSGGADDLTLGSLLGGATLPAGGGDALRGALAAALHPVFLIGLPLMLVAFAATLLVEGRELRTSVHEPGEAGRELFDELGDEFRETSPLATGGQR